MTIIKKIIKFLRHFKFKVSYKDDLIESDFNRKIDEENMDKLKKASYDLVKMDTLHKREYMTLNKDT